MRLAQRPDDLRLVVGRIDRLEAKLGHAFLASALADRRRGAIAGKNVPVPSVYQEQRS